MPYDLNNYSKQEVFVRKIYKPGFGRIVRWTNETLKKSA